MTIRSAKSPIFSNVSFGEAPEYIKRRFGSDRKIYKLKDVFSPTNCFRFQNKFRYAVYKHMAGGTYEQRRAVLSVAYHELDYPEAEPTQQRVYYHRFCDSGCDFFKHMQETEDPLTYEKHTTKNNRGEEIPWDHGIFAGMDLLFPLAFKQLCSQLLVMANPNLISRCHTLRTTNGNESLNSKVFAVIQKRKHHKKPRVTFALQQVAMAHNFGHYRASLQHVLGTMGDKAKEGLSYKDRESLRVATRKYLDARQYSAAGSGTGISHRLKVAYVPPREGGVDAPRNPSPPSTPRRRSSPRSVTPWVHSGDYGIGD